jgi:hypothetical protein
LTGIFDAGEEHGVTCRIEAGGGERKERKATRDDQRENLCAGLIAL